MSPTTHPVNDEVSSEGVVGFLLLDPVESSFYLDTAQTAPYSGKISGDGIPIPLVERRPKRYGYSVPAEFLYR